MPTILRFRNFRLMIYTEDHVPDHVHAVGPGTVIIFNLLCAEGSIAVRSNRGVSSADENALARFIRANLDLLCREWKGLHGHRTRAR